MSWRQYVRDQPELLKRRSKLPSSVSLLPSAVMEECSVSIADRAVPGIRPRAHASAAFRLGQHQHCEPASPGIRSASGMRVQQRIGQA